MIDTIAVGHQAANMWLLVYILEIIELDDMEKIVITRPYGKLRPDDETVKCMELFWWHFFVYSCFDTFNSLNNFTSHYLYQ